MTKQELFDLYKKVQQKDRKAEDTLISEHKKRYPSNHLNKLTRDKCSEYRQNLHTMYLHLSR